MTPPANPADYSVGIEMSVQESFDGAVLPVLSALVPLWHTPVLGTYYAGHRPSTTPVNLKKEDVNQLHEGRLASYGAVSSMRMALLLIRHTDDAVLTVMNTVLSGALWDQDDPDDHCTMVSRPFQSCCCVWRGSRQLHLPRANAAIQSAWHTGP